MGASEGLDVIVEGVAIGGKAGSSSRIENYIGFPRGRFRGRAGTGRDAAVVGGANSAGQAALFLARHAGQVHVLIRRDDLRDTMSTYPAQRLTHHERVTVHPRSELSAIHGTSRLSALNWRDHVLERDVRLDAAGLFLMIGADPSTTWLHEVGVELDAKGFVVTRDGFVTSVPGVFAAGDVRAGSVKRVASAVGEGSVVISAVHSYLAGTETSWPLRWSSTVAETPPNDNRRMNPLCHTYDASITSASPSRTSTP
jgi:Pyridine nucleotide-disulphide oxidoreductase